MARPLQHPCHQEHPYFEAAGEFINIGLVYVNQTRYYRNNFWQYQWTKGIIEDFCICYSRVTQKKWEKDSMCIYPRSTLDLPEPHSPSTLDSVATMSKSPGKGSGVARRGAARTNLVPRVKAAGGPQVQAQGRQQGPEVRHPWQS